jgi:AbrB family looped-hinge helix DNA binding protein
MDYSDNPQDSKGLFRRIQGLVGEQSFSLILPKQYAINLGIRKGDYVKVRQEDGKIIVERA